MMPGAFVPVRAVRRRTTIMAVTVITRGGDTHHAWWSKYSLNNVHEGVYWITGHHDPDCDALEALRAAEALR